MQKEFLLDTHYLLWVLTGSQEVSNSVLRILSDPKNTIHYSTASMWEISIKHKLGKLPVSGEEIMHYCEQAGFKKLPIDDRHIVALETLDWFIDIPEHKVPFDRMLVSQAKSDGMTFITHDKMFSGFNEPCVSIF